MIELSTSRIELINLPVTLKALENLDYLIEKYSEDKPGPAHVSFKVLGGVTAVEMQLDRAIALTALRSQRQKLVDYLYKLGIKAE